MPSELYRIDDDLSAYFFNRAIATFGLAVEAEIEKATRTAKSDKEAQNKARLILHKWLSSPEDLQPKSSPQKFRDPMERFKKVTGDEEVLELGG